MSIIYASIFVGYYAIVCLTYYRILIINVNINRWLLHFLFSTIFGKMMIYWIQYYWYMILLVYFIFISALLFQNFLILLFMITPVFFFMFILIKVKLKLDASVHTIGLNHVTFRIYDYLIYIRITNGSISFCRSK